MSENQLKKMDRPSRLRLYIAPTLLLLLSLAFTVGWIIVSNRVEAHLDRLIADEASKGRLWSCGSRKFAGFPFRIEVECLDARVKVTNELNFEAKLPRVIGVAQIYDPSLVIVEAEGPLSTSQSDRPIISASWTMLRSSLHMQADRIPDRLALVGEGINIKYEANGQSAAMTKGELHLRVKPADNKPANDLEFAARAEGLSSDMMSGVPANFETAGILEQGFEFLKFKGPETIDIWRRANGRLILQSFLVSRGYQSLDLKGTLGLDEQRRPTGQIEFAGKGLDDFFKSAGFSKFSALQTASVRVPLIFVNGYLLLGPFKMAELRPLY